MRLCELKILSKIDHTLESDSRFRALISKNSKSVGTKAFQNIIIVLRGARKKIFGYKTKASSNLTGGNLASIYAFITLLL